MAVYHPLRRAAIAAQRALASADSRELAEIFILCLLGMLASVILLVPGDQTGDGLRRILACFFG